MKFLVLDNYDSFTYNLVHILRDLEIGYEVHRNDALSVEEGAAFDAIILSPGPGLPSGSGIMPALISRCLTTHPILGVCLGHQALAEHLGASLRNMPQVYHGVKSSIRITAPSILFQNLPVEIEVGRYHSWEISRDGLPSCIQVTAEDSDGCIMAFQHESLPVYGVQFHPESIMTNVGKAILENFVEAAHSSIARISKAAS